MPMEAYGESRHEEELQRALCIKKIRFNIQKSHTKHRDALKHKKSISMITKFKRFIVLRGVNKQRGCCRRCRV